MFGKFLINIIVPKDSKIIITLHEIIKEIFIKKNYKQRVFYFNLFLFNTAEMWCGCKRINCKRDIIVYWTNYIKNNLNVTKNTIHIYS